MSQERPTHCPARQHRLVWLTGDVAVCTDGHPKTVWHWRKHGRGMKLFGDYSVAALSLAFRLREVLV